MLRADNQTLPIAALAAVFIAGAVLAGLFGNQNVAPYIGIAIAIAGISISIQQFYIRSMVSTVVSVERRDFYRGSSLALLCIGSGIVLFGIARIIVEIEAENVNPALINYVITCSTLGGICLAFSGPLFWNLMFAFTIVSESNSSKQAGRDNENSNNGNESVNQSQSNNLIRRIVDNMPLSKVFGSNIYNTESKLLYWLNLLYWSVSLLTALCLIWHSIDAFASLNEGTPLELHYLNAPITFPHIHSSSSYSILSAAATLWLLLTILVSGVYSFALTVRLLVLSSKGSTFSGMIFMVGFSCLFMVPALFHTCLSLMLSFSEFKILSAYILSTTVIASVLVLCLGVGSHTEDSRLDKFYSGLYRKIFKDAQTVIDSAHQWKATLDHQLPARKESNAPTYVFGILLLVLTGAITVFHSDSYSQAWIYNNLAGFYSFAFLALGCAGITAIDLRSASNAFQGVVENYLNSEAQATLAHEVHNNLRAIEQLIYGEPLKRLLATAKDDNQADDLKRVTDILAASQQGLAAVNSMIENLQKRREMIANVNQNGDVVGTVKNIVQLYKNSLPLDLSKDFMIDKDFTINFAVGKGAINARWNQQGLYQALRILLDNAVQATSKEKLNSITVSVRTGIEGGWGARISVQDSGVGMPPEVAKKFGQPQASTKAKGGSQGIGLSLAAAFCKYMDGNLALAQTSSYGDNTGTEIEILLASATKVTERIT